jgi:hypothetical protein
MDNTGSIFVCAERDGTNGNANRLSILKYTDSVSSASNSSSSSTLIASAEWDITKDFPDTKVNYSLEGIVWISDVFLTARKFFDFNTGSTYSPGAYPNHGEGLFFVAHEGTGGIYGYALLPNGEAKQICSFPSGDPTVASLWFDQETGYIWSECDNSSDGHVNVHALNNASGLFSLLQAYERPSSMPNYNNEGFAVSPDGLCSGGMKAVYWSDDGADDGHVIRRDAVPCGQFLG